MIEQLFGSKTRVKMLYLFFKNPERSFFVREIVREIGSQLNAVRREIANLEDMGLLGEIKKDNVEGEVSNSRAKFLKLKTDCLIYPELKDLLFKGEILQEQAMVRELQNKAGDLKLLLLTGQFTDCLDIKTDILFVGTVKPVVVSRVINNFEKNTNKEIRYTVMSEKEFCERKEIGDKFLYSILESKLLTIVDNMNLYEN